MFNIWNKPHPFIFNAYSVAVPSIITLIILLLFSPFSISELNTNLKIIVSVSISAIVAVSIFLTVRFLKVLFPKKMAEENWTVGKEFLLVSLVLFIIVILILLASLVFLSNRNGILTLFFQTAGLTIVISIFPILISVLFEQFRHQKAQLLKVSQITKSLELRNRQLEKEKTEEKESSRVLIKSEGNDIELQLDANDLIFIKSDGNYVDVYFKRSEKVEKKLIRNKLKSVQFELPDNQFLRCHNRYIVNIDKIVKVEGNARNLSLFLKETDEIIPVSRAKAKTVEERLNKM